MLGFHLFASSQLLLQIVAENSKDETYMGVYREDSEVRGFG